MQLTSIIPSLRYGRRGALPSPSLGDIPARKFVAEPIPCVRSACGHRRLCRASRSSPMCPCCSHRMARFRLRLEGCSAWRAGAQRPASAGREHSREGASADDAEKSQPTRSRGGHARIKQKCVVPGAFGRAFAACLNGSDCAALSGMPSPHRGRLWTGPPGDRRGAKSRQLDAVASTLVDKSQVL